MEDNFLGSQTMRKMLFGCWEEEETDELADEPLDSRVSTRLTSEAIKGERRTRMKWMGGTREASPKINNVDFAVKVNLSNLDCLQLNISKGKEIAYCSYDLFFL
jgi:hypothetical protein